ncbi:MAG: response regulator, partial [Paenibacillus sp.]|nr:response regulator [Paenibacillus sp.]
RNRKMMEQWVEHLKTLKLETMPHLIVETLELLEQWIEGRYYLLNSLCNIWLNSVIEELMKENTVQKWEEGTDAGLGDETLPQEKMRSYFRLCAVRRLEEGAHQLFIAMRGVKDEQSTKLITDMTAFIKLHFTNKLDLQSIADHVGISKNYMSTLFKQEMNTTVLNYIVDLRMKKARELLLQSNYKSYEIANRVGYDNIDYFTGLFKKHYGFTPIDFKKRMDHE